MRLGSHFDAIKRYAIPTSDNISPSGANSKRPNGFSPLSTPIELTSRLVEVPMSVHTPPNWLANDTGIST